WDDLVAPLAHAGEEAGAHARHVHAHGLLVDRLGDVHAGERGRAKAGLRERPLARDTVEVEGDVFGGDGTTVRRRAVVPVRVLPDVEDVLHAVAGDFPAFKQLGDQL